MASETLVAAAVAWALATALWLGLMPRETRGKSWHYVLAAAPLAVLAARLALPPSPLRDSLDAWLASGVGVLAVAAVSWAWGTLIRNHGVMDVCYPAAPVAATAVVLGVQGRAPGGPEALLLALLAVWSVRLVVQTWGHNLGAERQPYAHWRGRFGPRWLWWSAFQVHLLQGVTVWLWCAPLAFALSAPRPAPWPLAAAGAAVWLAGFLLQTAADRQLAAFKADPANRGRLLDTGAWAWVRHPNYLGEAVMWAAGFVFALAHPQGWITLFAPVFTGWFMGYASAAPFKEAHMARTRGAAWAAYCARVPRFLPWPRPRSGAQS